MSIKLNPYQSPSVASRIEFPKETSADRSDVVDFREIVRRWEIWRIGYNVVLIGWVALLTLIFRFEIVRELEFWVGLVVCGAIANSFYFLGPLAEGYGRVVRFWHKFLAASFFALGLLVTGAFAGYFVMIFELAD